MFNAKKVEIDYPRSEYDAKKGILYLEIARYENGFRIFRAQKDDCPTGLYFVTGLDPHSHRYEMPSRGDHGGSDVAPWSLGAAGLLAVAYVYSSLREASCFCSSH